MSQAIRLARAALKSVSCKLVWGFSLILGGGLFGNSGVANALTWDLSTLPVSGTHTLEITVQVDNGTAGSTLVNVISNTQNQSDTNLTADDPSETLVVNNPVIGVAKNVGTVTYNSNGTYTVPFTLVVENFGNTDLYDIALLDNLSTEFGTFVAGTPTSAGEYTVSGAPIFTNTANGLVGNAAYDGDTQTNLVDTAAGGFLAVGETATISFTIISYPDLSAFPFLNSAEGQGDTNANGTADGDTVDNSMAGTEPDANGNDNPLDDASATVVDFPFTANLGVAKAASVTGNQVQLTFVFENTGNIPVENLVANDDLDTVFGAGNYTVSAVNSSNGSLHDPAFTGTGSNQSLLASGQTMPAESSETVDVFLTVDTLSDQGFGFAQYFNQISGQAEDVVFANSISDTSTNGLVPDADGNGTATNDSDPTPIMFGALDAQKRLTGIVSAGAPNQYLATFEFTLTNISGVSLTDISLTDDFFGQNVGSIASINGVPSGSIIPSNPAVFTATTFDNTFIQSATASPFSGGAATLGAGESVVVEAQVDFTIVAGATSLTNVALAAGTDANGGVVSDTSDDNGELYSAGNDATLLPIDPSGIVYDSTTGAPITGVTVEMQSSAGTPIPAVCFPAGQQPQVTGADGMYRFDIIVGNDPACPPTETEYVLALSNIPGGYFVPPSSAITPQAGSYQATGCPAPQGDLNGIFCSIGQTSPAPTGDTEYFYSFLIESGDPQIIRNHLPLDPATAGSVAVVKTVNPKTASIGDIVQYAIDVENLSTAGLPATSLVDTMPVGIQYQAGTATVNGVNQEPVAAGNVLTWTIPSMASGGTAQVLYAAILGPGIRIGQATNTAGVESTTGTALSSLAMATLEVIPDPVFNCSDIIGKVFEDTNRDGYHTEGEQGIAGTMLFTVNGLQIEADDHGRFHIGCAQIPNHLRGSNFVIKLDERTLPMGYHVTTENPRVVRLTQGKTSKTNFGAAAGRVIEVRLNQAGFMEDNRPTTAAINYMDVLIEKLAPHKNGDMSGLEEALLFVGYELAEGESEKDAQVKLNAFERTLQQQWRQAGKPYKLQIQTQVERTE